MDKKYRFATTRINTSNIALESTENPIPRGGSSRLGRKLWARRLWTLWIGIVILVPMTTGSASASVITVDTDQDIDDADGVCSLREAIVAANMDVPYQDCVGGEGEDRIVFSLVPPSTITLMDNLPAITDDLKITGLGANLLAIDGASQFRPLELRAVTSRTWLSVENLTISNGRTPSGSTFGGGVLLDSNTSAFLRHVHLQGNSSENTGGGLRVFGREGETTELTMIGCTFEGNFADGPAGGGGISISGQGVEALIVGSTFTQNETTHPNGSGAGIAMQNSSLTLQSSTLSDNRSSGSGGAIRARASIPSAALIIRNSTITKNRAQIDGSIGAAGGGLLLFSNTGSSLLVKIENSVIAGNFDLSPSENRDISCNTNLPTLEVTGSNFIGSNEGCDSVFPDGFPNSAGDFVGTMDAPLDPLLEDLATNSSSPTPFHEPSLSPLSPLIDQGNCPEAITDQRGRGSPISNLRAVDVGPVPNLPGGDTCDIGAVEVFGAAGTDPRLFADGFESGNTLQWDLVVQ